MPIWYVSYRVFVSPRFNASRSIFTYRGAGRSDDNPDSMRTIHGRNVTSALRVFRSTAF